MLGGDHGLKVVRSWLSPGRGGEVSVWAAISTIISLLALMTAMAVFWAQRRHAHFELACLLHRDLTTGEVAEARDKLGTLLHDPVRFTPDDLPEVRTAYFTLLWCFERIYLGRRVMVAGRVPSKRPLRLLDDLVTYQVRYWDENLPAIKQAIETLGDVKDEREREALIKLIRDMQGGSGGRVPAPPSAYPSL
jgi:hypothetical protein